MKLHIHAVLYILRSYTPVDGEFSFFNDYDLQSSIFLVGKGSTCFIFLISILNFLPFLLPFREISYEKKLKKLITCGDFYDSR